jgi:chloramphenicol-sensitive protein RarD
MPDANATARELRKGLWIAAGSFVLWGVMPLYWHLLKAVPSLQIVAHRVLWSALLVFAWLGWKYGRGWLRETLSRPHVAWMLTLSGLLIGFNWGLYIWAVNAGHVVETALGYFINPLLNVLIGVAFLRERLRAAQWLSVAIAAAGVLWLTFDYGRPPWIALALAGSFAIYGVLRKVSGAAPIRGLGVESLVLLLPGLALLGWGEAQGQGAFDALPAGASIALPAALLVLAGALTALPLIGFAFAVQRVPYSVVGVMQYIAPTLQFLIGVFVFGEAFDADRAIGFVLIWIALALFAGEGLLRARRLRPVPVV